MNHEHRIASSLNFRMSQTMSPNPWGPEENVSFLFLIIIIILKKGDFLLLMLAEKKLKYRTPKDKKIEGKEKKSKIYKTF